MTLKKIIKQLKEKKEELDYKRKDKQARAKGFSNFSVYEIETAVARKEGYDKAQKANRTKELERVKNEEYQKAIGKETNYITKLNKGLKQFNKMMGDNKPTKERKSKSRRSKDPMDFGLGPAPKLNLWGKQETFKLSPSK